MKSTNCNVNFKHFHPPKGRLVPICRHSPFPPAALGNHLSAFCL